MVLKLIVDLECEIEKFVFEIYFIMYVYFNDYVVDYVILKDICIGLEEVIKIVEIFINLFLVSDII